MGHGARVRDPQRLAATTTAYEKKGLVYASPFFMRRVWKSQAKHAPQYPPANGGPSTSSSAAVIVVWSPT